MRRRSARATALRALFAIDLGKNDMESALRAALAEEQPDPEGVPFARELLLGVLEHQSEIDQSIGLLSRDWSLARLAAVDRNLLRLAIFELSYRQEQTPMPVVINEAVELAKEYSTPESGRFVNGILGSYARRTGAVAETTEQPAPALGADDAEGGSQP